MRLLGLVLIAAGLGGGGWLAWYWSPRQIRARRRVEALEDARTRATENELLDRQLDQQRKEHPWT